MKKNKTFTNVLLIVVPGLWLFFFYRVYTSFFVDNTKQTQAYEPSAKKKVKLDETEKFFIKANYPDPFAAKINFASFSTSKEDNSSIKQTKSKKEAVKIDWSFIQFIGLIKNQNHKKQVALVAVNGKEHMVSEGDRIEGITFSRLSKNSVKASYQNASQIISK